MCVLYWAVCHHHHMIIVVIVMSWLLLRLRLCLFTDVYMYIILETSTIIHTESLSIPCYISVYFNIAACEFLLFGYFMFYCHIFFFFFFFKKNEKWWTIDVGADGIYIFVFFSFLFCSSSNESYDSRTPYINLFAARCWANQDHVRFSYIICTRTALLL